MDQYGAGWRPWPVVWSAVFVGALSALAVALIIGLIGFAVGAHEVARQVSWRDVRLTTLIFNVAGAFFAFVAGGWVAARIADFRRAEPAILHGAIVWLVTIPALLALAATGAIAGFGGWLGTLGGFHAAPAAVPSGTDVAAAMRNTALSTLAGLLVGLMGSVIGGWMASGEPMTLGYYRRRARGELVEGEPPARRVA
jgi:hypothetical protein